MSLLLIKDIIIVFLYVAYYANINLISLCYSLTISYIRNRMKKEVSTTSTNIILLALSIAIIATLGSLFFSEVMGFVPCTMCWYQRIFMYPLVLIFLTNLLYPDNNVFKYSIVLVVAGLVFSIYHNLLLFDIIPASAVPCASGVPCSTKYINWFGFINIPLLSFISYFMIFVLLIFSRNKRKEI